MVFSIEEGKGIGLFIPPIHEIVISAICLAIIFFFIKKYAVPRFYKILEKRQKSIVQKVDDANKIMVDAKLKEQDVEKQHQNIKNTAKEIQQSAHIKATQLLKETEDKANLEYVQIVNNAKEKIENERTKALTEAEIVAKKKSVILAKKILQEKLSDKKLTDKIFDNMVSS
jgi:F-type H+-transporting ATPase subunit b